MNVERLWLRPDVDVISVDMIYAKHQRVLFSQGERPICFRWCESEISSLSLRVYVLLWWSCRQQTDFEVKCGRSPANLSDMSQGPSMFQTNLVQWLIIWCLTACLLLGLLVPNTVPSVQDQTLEFSCIFFFHNLFPLLSSALLHSSAPLAKSISYLHTSFRWSRIWMNAPGAFIFWTLCVLFLLKGEFTEKSKIEIPSLFTDLSGQFSKLFWGFLAKQQCSKHQKKLGTSLTVS